MSEKKQSSIDWLTEKISYQTSNGEVITYHKNIADLIQQAKAMHREEIIEAHGIKEFHGAEGSRNFWQQVTGEQYYTENYERQDNKH